MQLTSNYRLRKPDGTDPVDVKDFNDNADVIDKELAKKADKTGTASDMVTSFTQSASRTNITSGEKLSTSFGKIMKFFTDLKAVAFSGSYNDLSNKPTIPSGAAANYPVANNDTTNNAGYLVTAQVAYQHGKEIDQINSDLVINSTKISTKYLPDITLKKYGKIVTIQCGGMFKQHMNSGQHYSEISLPKNYAPSEQVMYYVTQMSKITLSIIINTDGSIVLETNSEAGVSWGICVNLMYIV